MLLAQIGIAQVKTAETLARDHIQAQLTDWELLPEDVKSLRKSDEYASSHNGVTHLYFQQLYNGIEILNAVGGVHILPNGKIGYATNGFEGDLLNRIQHTQPAIDAATAIRRSAIHLGVDAGAPLELVRENGKNDRTYRCQKISATEINAQLKYFCPAGHKEIHLVWNIRMAPNQSNDQWEVKVDAADGNILGKNNLVIKCRFSASGAHAHTTGCYAGVAQLRSKPAPFRPNTNPPQGEETRYNVFPIPVESPLHGDRQVISSPADEVASPFGWHDVNGDGEADYTFTRGNNAHVYLDKDGDDALDGEGPDGGESLVFDFPFDGTAPADSNTNAAMVQAFYMANVMHDFAYNYGFTESAGNFQNNNRGMGGNAQDHVLVEVQDGSATNNATFATPTDGTNGRMQIFLWDQGQGKIMEILEPEIVRGKYEAGTASYGPPISEEEALEGTIVEAFDETRDPDKGCETIVNPDEVRGKIAMVNRGICFFQQKTLNVEEAGAIALIICNFEDNTVGLGGVDNLSNPQIPTISLKNSDCANIRLAINEGVQVKLQIPSSDGPEFLDASFDNGVVAHEYAHGISTRLTGGPGQSGCLNNDEQMGEGWSDFFSLIMTARPEEQGLSSRGIGTYLLREEVDDTGIRRKPYSTSPSINDQIYEDIMGTGAPHPLGEVWTSVLWDLYWKFVEVYGWDEDIYAGTGGNNMAVQLVMDGLKLQDCQPGFIDGRNAILAADLLNFNGENQCLIWEVFAGRGLGWSADQNSSLLRDDAIAGFDVMPECIKTLKIAKETTPNIAPGEDMLVTLTVTNHRDNDAENVLINDEIPVGAQFAGIEENGEGIQSEMMGQEATFRIGSLPSGDSRTFTYRLSSSPDRFSTELYFDDFEVENFAFVPDNIKQDTNTNIWRLDNTIAASGEKSWFIPSTPSDIDQGLVQLEPITITGAQPTLFFKQNYRIEPGNDGGIVEVSTNGGLDWDYLPAEKFFRKGYTGRLNYGALVIPFLRAFWGETKGFVDTYADLSDYIGQDIQLRFRFGSDDEGQGGSDPGRGWNIDDLMIFDLFNYNAEACVTADGAGTVCTRAEGKGTIVNTGSLVATNVEDALASPLAMQIFPNPSHNRLNVRLTGSERQAFDLQVYTMDGKLMQGTQLESGQSSVIDHTFNIENWPEGIYVVKTIAPGFNLVEKFVKN